MPMMVLLQYVHRRRQIPPGCCRRCGYDLRDAGAVSGVRGGAGGGAAEVTTVPMRRIERGGDRMNGHREDCMLRVWIALIALMLVRVVVAAPTAIDPADDASTCAATAAKAQATSESSTQSSAAPSTTPSTAPTSQASTQATSQQNPGNNPGNNNASFYTIRRQRRMDPPLPRRRARAVGTGGGRCE